MKLNIFAILFFLLFITTHVYSNIENNDVLFVDSVDTNMINTKIKENSKTQAIDKLAFATKATNASLVLPMGTSIRMTDRGKVLVTKEKFLFPENGCLLVPDNAKDLKDIIEYVVKSNENIKIILESHTGTKGPAYPNNYNLSVSRALVARRYVSNFDIESDRVMTVGLGESIIEYGSENALRRYEIVLIENNKEFDVYKNYVNNLNFRKDSDINSLTSMDTLSDKYLKKDGTLNAKKVQKTDSVAKTDIDDKKPEEKKEAIKKMDTNTETVKKTESVSDVKPLVKPNKKTNDEKESKEKVEKYFI